MNKTFEATAKMLLGEKYQRLWRSAISVVVLCLLWNSLDDSIEISPLILILSITGFTWGVILQTLSSDSHRVHLKGLLLLPFARRNFNFGYIGALSLYALVTKTALVLTLFVGFGEFSIAELAGAVLAAVNACMAATLLFVLVNLRQRARFVLLAGSQLAVVASSVRPPLFFALLGCSMAAFALLLGRMDSYGLLRWKVGPKRHRRRVHRGRTALVVYLVRYLSDHRSYLLNSLALMVFAVMFSFVFGSLGSPAFLPLGFGVLAMNTPLAILWSSDRSTRRHLAQLPNQLWAISIPYGMCIFGATGLIYAVYLTTWFAINGAFPLLYLPVAVFFALQCAVCTVYLEWKHPLDHWKVESDLWHHPRKYIIPAAILLQAVLLAAWAEL